MKLFEKTVTRGGFYSFLFAIGLLIFSVWTGNDAESPASLYIRNYFICAAAGYVTAIVGLIFETKLDPILKRLIHFVALLAGFVTVFATAASGTQSVATKILVGIVIFVIAYALVFLVIFGLKKLIAFIEKKRGIKSGAEGSDEKYTPRYK